MTEKRHVDGALQDVLDNMWLIVKQKFPVDGNVTQQNDNL